MVGTTIGFPHERERQRVLLRVYNRLDAIEEVAHGPSRPLISFLCDGAYQLSIQCCD